MASRAWKSKYYIDAYALATTGLTNQEIGKVIGVSAPTFRKWVKEKRLLKYAIDRGRKSNKKGSTETFKEYIYGHLPDDLKELWNDIIDPDLNENGFNVLERLEGQSQKAKQSLYFHALIAYNFNPSKALHAVGLSKREVDKWSNDPDFAELVTEFNFHKKNFFEGALLNLVSRGDASAVLFANRTINRDRGYNDKQELSISGSVDINVNIVQIDELNLPLKLKKDLLAAIRLNTETQKKLNIDDKEISVIGKRLN